MVYFTTGEYMIVDKKRALRITIAIARRMVPMVQAMMKQVEEAKAANSDGGVKITKAEKWAIAEEAAFTLMPQIIEAVTDSLE
jgi:hypothetical protein